MHISKESESLLLCNGLVFIDPTKQWPIPVHTNGTLDDLEPSVWKFNTKIVISDHQVKKTFVWFSLRKQDFTRLLLLVFQNGKGLVVSDKSVQVSDINYISLTVLLI